MSQQPPERHQIVVEINARPGETLADSVDWLERFFSYFHPTMKAVVLTKGKGAPTPKPADPEPVPGSDLLS